jgi:vacuolar-type H+-ATPase subunit I/STV1
MVLNNKLIKELEEEAEELKKRTEERKKLIEEEQIKNIKDINYLYKLNEIIFLMKEAEAIKETKEETKKETKKEILKIMKKTKKELKEEAKKKNNLREIKEELKELYRDKPKETRQPTTDKLFFKEDAEELDDENEADEMKEYLNKSSIICIINNTNPNLKDYERNLYKTYINYEWGDNIEDYINYELRQILEKYNLEFVFYSHNWGYLKNKDDQTDDENEN